MLTLPIYNLIWEINMTKNFISVFNFFVSLLLKKNLNNPLKKDSETILNPTRFGDWENSGRCTDF